ncbi:MAG: zf-HC2 domain-containing protein [Myxococcales bacterium]|nr:zf-HC2 domain-containing protein [Myxococcales bacterium]MCB9714409.1 zf-HC2 domain-containing protein [Myxococcales bacterium]
MKVIVLDGHPRQEELADYVSDALSAAQSERLEEHLLDCPRCAARLQEAASFQLLLHEAAESLESDRRAPPSRLRRVGRRLGAVGGLWGAAAAFALVLMRPPTDDTEPVPVVTLADDPSPERSDDRRWSGECDPTDIGCAEALLASVDPLESVDPLSSWPDDPLVRSVFDSEPSLEPCGSGEDGGMLVCPVDDDPFSG